MDELSLRNERFQVSRLLILGCSPLAGIYRTIPEHEAYQTIRTALDLGFLDLDTAPHYGLGLSETRLGRAVAMYGSHSSIRIWSKVTNN